MSRILTTRQQRTRAEIVLVVLGILFYANTITHEYAMDDGYSIYNNEFTKQGLKGIPGICSYDYFMGAWMFQHPGLTPEQIMETESCVEGGRWRPLSLITFAVEVELFGLNPHVGHIMNIVYYILLTLLIFNVLFRLIPNTDGRRWYLTIPFVAALLFLAHPIHTEVIANIKGRDEILAMMGVVGSLWFILRYIDTNKGGFLVGAFFAFLLGLLSKENAITYLAVAPLVIYLFTSATGKQNFLSWIPLFLATCCFVVLRTTTIGWFGNVNIEGVMNNPFLYCTPAEKYATIFFTLGKYIQLLFYPHPLTWDYYPWHISITDWSNVWVIVIAIFYVFIGIMAIVCTVRRKNPIVAASIWLYLIPLSIVSNIFFPIGAFMGDRFVFMSSLGFCLFMAWLVAEVIYRWATFNMTTVIVLLVLILGGYGYKTISRNMVWKNNFTLLTHDINISQNSAKGHHDVGCVYYMETIDNEDIKNDFEKKLNYYKLSISHLQQAYKINNDYTSALTYLNGAWNTYARIVIDTIAHAPNTIYNDNPAVDKFISILRNGPIDASPTLVLEYASTLNKKGLRPEEKDYIIGFIYGCYFNDYNKAISLMRKAEAAGYNNMNCTSDIATTYFILHDYQTALQMFHNIHERLPKDMVAISKIAQIYEILGDYESSIQYQKLLQY